MKLFTYLSLIPEALILSHLPPEEFGNYLAVGTRKRSRGQAIYFEVDPDFQSEFFKLDEAKKRCVPHPDGTLKHSVYVSIYKVLENIPLAALRDLFLVTDDGRVLRIAAAPFEQTESRRMHLYQELCPVAAMVASRHDPREFGQRLTTPNQPICLPKVFFCELILGNLALDPAKGEVENLPYPQIDHLRDCLVGLETPSEKASKIVVRQPSQGILYRTVRTGFFVAGPEGLLFYPMPSKEALDTEHYHWWRSANEA